MNKDFEYEVCDLIMKWTLSGPHYTEDINPDAIVWMAVACEGIARDLANLTSCSNETREALNKAADVSLAHRTGIVTESDTEEYWE